MSEKQRCTDEYGNPTNGLTTGSVVESDLAIFTVGKINSHNWLVSMDKDKPYKIKDKNHPMAKCVESGHYAVYAGYLCFSSLEDAVITD